MFFLLVTEKAAFRWLGQAMGDTELILSTPPRPWESPVLYVGRVDGRCEIARVLRLVETLKPAGACFHANHEQTRKIGERIAAYRCGNKFFVTPESYGIRQ